MNELNQAIDRNSRIYWVGGPERMREELCQGPDPIDTRSPMLVSDSVASCGSVVKICAEYIGAKMDLVPPLSGVQACSVQPLEDYEGPRAPLLRQVSLDEERRDDCQGHWRGHVGGEEERGVRLFRAMLLQHLRLEELRPPPCIVAPSRPDERGWWMYWRDWRALERAARRFRESKAQARLAERARHISLLSLDEVEFEDIMQELGQACAHVDQRALVILAFLCEVCARAVRTGGWCRAADWAARHVARCATPWAVRHGGWSAVVERAGAGGARREEGALLAGAAVAALLAFLLFCRARLRHALL